MHKMQYAQQTLDCRIVWAEPGKRIRKVVKRSNARTTGKYPSWKMRRMLQWESKIERDTFHLNDADTEILTFDEQPACVIYWLGGQWHEHYPDTLVTSRTGRRFVEIKDQKGMNDPFVRQRAEYLAAALSIQGIGYELLGEDEIRTEPRLTNARDMIALGRAPVRDLEREAIRRIIDEAGSLTWGEVLAGVAGKHGIFQVARLILEGTLLFDYTANWTTDTVILPGHRLPGVTHGRR